MAKAVDSFRGKRVSVKSLSFVNAIFVHKYKPTQFFEGCVYLQHSGVNALLVNYD